MMKELTKKQAKEFARIQAGQLLNSYSGLEFDGSNLEDDEIERCFDAMKSFYQKLFKKPDEWLLLTTQKIIDYVKDEFEKNRRNT